MSEDQKPAKRPAGWLAALLNLLVPPIGYAYIGSLRWAIGFVVLVVCVGVALSAYSVQNPPGLIPTDALGPLHAVGWAINLAAAIHVVFLNRSMRPRRNLMSLIVVGVLLWLVPLSLGLAARYFAPFATYRVASASMAPTLIKGDVVLARGGRVLCGRVEVTPGDVIISRSEGATYSHRAVAGPGQTVAIIQGRLVIDGVPVATQSLGGRTDGPGRAEIVRETLSNGRTYLTTDMGAGPLDHTPPVKVPEGHWFTLGDNRDNAIDSRVRGPVPASSICGVADQIVTSTDRDRVGMRP